MTQHHGEHIRDGKKLILEAWDAHFLRVFFRENTPHLPCAKIIMFPVSLAVGGGRYPLAIEHCHSTYIVMSCYVEEIILISALFHESMPHMPMLN